MKSINKQTARVRALARVQALIQTAANQYYTHLRAIGFSTKDIRLIKVSRKFQARWRLQSLRA